MIFRANRWFSMGLGIRVVLGIQAVLAILLLMNGAEARLQRPELMKEPRDTGPVAPGDQLRRYEPVRTAPSYLDSPEIKMPSEFPDRLEFDVVELEQIGSVVLLQGAIETGDASRLEVFIDDLPEPPEMVALNSPGGTVAEALAIGQSLKERQFDTVVPTGMVCVSSCPYIFAAGDQRIAFSGGALGLHQHYYDTPNLLPAFWAVENIQQGQGMTMAYLIEMGIDPSLMLYSLNTPPDDIYVLVEAELLETRLATEVREKE